MLFQVYSTHLDPEKGWYVLTEDVCGSAFRTCSQNSFFRLFPDELQKVPFFQLRDTSGNMLDPNIFGIKYQKCEVLVASTLGLCGALIRQRDLNDKSYFASESFKRIANAINNCCAITGLPRFGANSDINYHKELEQAKEKIRDLQSTLASRDTCTETNFNDESGTSPKRKKNKA